MHICLFVFLSTSHSCLPNSDSLSLLTQSYILTCILVCLFLYIFLFLYFFFFAYLTAGCLALCFSSIQAWCQQQQVVGPATQRFCRAFIASVSVRVSRGCVQRTVFEWEWWFSIISCLCVCVCVFWAPRCTSVTLIHSYSSDNHAYYMHTCLSVYLYISSFFVCFLEYICVSEYRYHSHALKFFFIFCFRDRVSRDWVLRSCAWVKVLIFYHDLTYIWLCF